MLLVVCAKYKLTETVNFLTSNGHDVLGLPILDIIPVAHNFPVDAEGILLTSSAPIDLIEHNDLPTYSIGEKTTERAIKAGFNVVYTGTGNAMDMAVDLAKFKLPKKCWHPTNPKGKERWYTQLPQTQIQRDIVYLLKPNLNMPNNIMAEFKENKITDILLMSAFGAQNFANLIIKNNIDVSKINLIAFSDSVMAEVKNFPFAQKSTLPTPSLSQLI